MRMTGWTMLLGLENAIRLMLADEALGAMRRTTSLENRCARGWVSSAGDCL
jgi:hypothetical protein